MDADDELIAQARIALLQAYAPYSRLRVGAAVRTASGQVHRGCNMENAAFPVGGCAEHHALAAAVQAEGPGVRVVAVAVAARDVQDRDVAIPPCGACRQLILELGPEATVCFRMQDGALGRFGIGELLPASFRLDTT
jgi:cytidine deaminase